MVAVSAFKLENGGWYAVQDPEAILDYVFPWGSKGWLKEGETVANRDVTVTGDLTKVSDTEADGDVTVTLSGGTTGETYVVRCRIITSAGRRDTRRFKLLVQER